MIQRLSPPFDLPRPFAVVSERYTEHEGTYADRSPGFWRLEDLATS